MMGSLTYLTTCIFLVAIMCSCPEYKLAWTHFIMDGITTLFEPRGTWHPISSGRWEACGGRARVWRHWGNKMASNKSLQQD